MQMSAAVAKPKPLKVAVRSTLVSLALHAIVLLCFLHLRSAYVAPVRLPGTVQGSHMVLTFAPGRSPAQQNATLPRQARATPQVVKVNRIQTALTPVRPVEAVNTPTPAQQPQDTQPGNDAQGTGDVNIALLSVFPTPRPDLAQLPRGTRGDVILDVVIDAQGKIIQLTMTKGIGHGVDESVIATVQQWLFHPATRNGVPVASEQELLFHYERS